MTARERFQMMPRLLKFGCIACVTLGVLGPLDACLPFGGFAILDEQLSTRELWEYGYGPFVMLFGIGLLAAGIGLLRGLGWSRWIVVFLYAFMIPLLAIHWLHHREKLGALILEASLYGGIWGGFSFWYLFRRHGRLFSSDAEPAATAQRPCSHLNRP